MHFRGKLSVKTKKQTRADMPIVRGPDNATTVFFNCCYKNNMPIVDRKYLLKWSIAHSRLNTVQK